VEYVRSPGLVAAPGQWRRVGFYLRPLASLALAAGLLALLLWHVNVSAVRDELARASLWWLPLAFFANLVSDWFRAIRWQYLFRPLARVEVPFLFGVAVIGVAANLALPFRAGEMVRLQVLRRRTGLKLASILATIISEKMMDVVAFSSFIALGLILYREAWFLWPLAMAYAAALGVGVLGARWLAGRAESGEQIFGGGSGRLRAWLAREMGAFGRGLQAFRRRALLHAVWASHAAWLCEAVMYYAVGRSLGLDLPFGVYLLAVVAATVAVSVPLTQAGLGVFEVFLTGLLVAFGLDKVEAAAFAIFAHVMLALPYFATGPLAAVALRVSPSDIFFVRRPAASDHPPAPVEPLVSEP
jgi:uncharacterized protein (TIRG00374 family)